MTDPTARHLADAEDAVRPLALLAEGLIVALHWWAADRATSTLGRFDPPDLDALAFFLVPLLDYSTRARAAVDAARATAH